MATTLVIVPTYNERENLAALITRVRIATPDADVLVVDDNSPDGTGAIADGLAASDSAVFVLHRTGKAGLGSAYGAAFRWGLARGYARLVEMDADGSHQPEQLPSLLAAADAGADVVLGSRWVPGGGVRNWPTYRELLSRGGSAYSRIVLGLPQRDVTGGYRVLTAHALESIRLEDVHSQGYGFQVDLLFHAARAGLRIVEVPILFVEREHGVSKMTGGIVAEAMFRVTLWGLGALPGRLKRRIGR
ncbi:polyprenol monophosphomannose synthase [Mycetocola manganoxydans]|uniref:Polyprenol monophosphomannose synthase n=1 Tax=Mycetocola manganoxydans TaxID=699879 RepID=A0A3L6ZU72_9MICO|nr:polyprenol monophosphomannose synthase [Mycetocola manganoxydans]RLP71400.1 polyprenol monophosphomannose synthase [Mycetocola manganoxydans]GHD46277.1 dolichol-phosphate mannosyltransferase [Mycetocola manganoxydans]